MVGWYLLCELHNVIDVLAMMADELLLLDKDITDQLLMLLVDLLKI